MGFRCGIVGLPNAGKSTIFNSLTAARAEVASYRFCTIQPNLGIVPVPDKRLEELARRIHPKKVTPTTLEFFDIAGLVKGASKGEGLGNQFLDHIRNVDAIAHTVRCFENSQVVHDFGSLDPVRDIEVVNTELILADLQTLERRMAKAEKLHRVGAKESWLGRSGGAEQRPDGEAPEGDRREEGDPGRPPASHLEAHLLHRQCGAGRIERGGPPS